MKNYLPLIMLVAGIVFLTASMIMMQNDKNNDKLKIIKLQDSIRMMHKVDSIKYSKR